MKKLTSSVTSRLTASLLAVAVASTSMVPLASAQGDDSGEAAPAKPTKEQRDAARAAYSSGEKAYKAKKYEEALQHFSAAYDLIPTPHAEFWMAMSADAAGKKTKAFELLEAMFGKEGHERIGEEKLAAAKKVYEELKKLTAKLTITTDPVGASVMIDGEPQTGTTPMTVDVPPGTHEITLALDGYEGKKVELKVLPEEKKEETITLVEKAEEPPPAPAPTPPPPAPEPEPKEPPKKEERSMVPAYVTLGIAGAGAVVGTLFGLQAMSAKSDFDDNPTDSKADDVERNALIADMAFGVMLTLGITGVVLLTAEDDDASSGGDAAARSKRNTAKSTLRVAPYVSPRGGGAAAHWTF